jgi:hypothetical protein
VLETAISLWLLGTDEMPVGIQDIKAVAVEVYGLSERIRKLERLAGVALHEHGRARGQP